jgi:hypothetical protein
MNWEQRLRDMVLAGGAGLLAAVACVDGSGANGDSGSDGNSGPSFCCNASSDPCCPSTYCGEPVSTACTQKMAEMMACESEGRAWDDLSGCSSLDSGVGDAPSDAVTNPDVGDAPFDAAKEADVSVFCCNANADPCCPSLHCGATVTVQCTEKMACEADGGTWDYGAAGCVRDAGQSD